MVIRRGGGELGLGEEVDIAPSYAPIRCRGKRVSSSIARVVKEAFNSR